jgi:hypothetical protein
MVLASRTRVAPPAGPGVACGHDVAVLIRLAYLTVTHAFAVLRLLPMSNRDKDVEILALRHQITWTSAAATGSVASSTNIDMPPELHGRNFRQAHDRLMQQGRWSPGLTRTATAHRGANR